MPSSFGTRNEETSREVRHPLESGEHTDGIGIDWRHQERHQVSGTNRDGDEMHRFKAVGFTDE